MPIDDQLAVIETFDTDKLIMVLLETTLELQLTVRREQTKHCIIGSTKRDL